MKCAFIYACGTGYLINDVNGLSVDLSQRIRWKDTLLSGTPGESKTVAGINGRSATWDLSSPAADPFHTLLDPEVWITESIIYPAAFMGGTGLLGLSMGASIDYGIDKMIKSIKNLPAGMPFAIGGYSQGAAVASGVYLSGLQTGTTGPLSSYRDRFLGGVAFGNPRKQRDYLGVHGVWSGAWDNPGSNSGGGGAFPATGPWRRLTGCEPDKWLEFTAPADIFAAVGTTNLGLGWNAAIDAFLDLTRSNILGSFFDGLVGDALLAFLCTMGDPTMIPPWAISSVPVSLRGPLSVSGVVNYMVDGSGSLFPFPGGGHTTYPLLPPCDLDGTWASSTTPVTNGDGHTYLKPTKDTCYQLALRWLEGKAAARANASIVLPSTPETTAGAGWSSTLLAPV